MITVDGQTYDGIVIKPELDDALEHYGVKGMKWKKRKAKLKGKIIDKATKFNRKMFITNDPSEVTTNYGKSNRIKNGKGIKDSGKATAKSGEKGSKFNSKSLIAARRRAGLAKKKKKK